MTRRGQGWVRAGSGLGQGWRRQRLQRWRQRQPWQWQQGLRWRQWRQRRQQQCLAVTGRDRSPGSAASRPCPQHLLFSQSGQAPPWHPEAMGCLCCRHKPTDYDDLPGPNPQRPIYDDQGNAHARARPTSITAEGTACGAMRARLAGNGSPSSGRQLGRGGSGR